MSQRLVNIPRIKFVVATVKLARRCPRCRKVIAAGQKYLDHSEGIIHSNCLRTGKHKVFLGR